MSTYKGVTIPDYEDPADAPAAFREFVDGLEGDGSPAGGFVKRENGSVGVAEETSPVVRNIWLSTGTPTSQQGIDGDVWIVYV